MRLLQQKDTAEYQQDGKETASYWLGTGLAAGLDTYRTKPEANVGQYLVSEEMIRIIFLGGLRNACMVAEMYPHRGWMKGKTLYSS